MFEDPQLQSLIREALAQNYDIRIAATRILQAQAVFGITKQTNSQQSPGIRRIQRAICTNQSHAAFETSPFQVNLSLAWELDFWGKFRRATEAARANLLATEWGQRAVASSLVSNVATAYFQLLELDAEMDISRRSLGSRKERLRLVRDSREEAANVADGRAPVRAIGLHSCSSYS